MKAWIAVRALIGIGLMLAWVGVTLPWERWGAGSSHELVTGLEESRPFWIALAVATVLAAVALFRHRRWPFAALGVVALVLIVIAVREIGENVAADSAFVPVRPGTGLLTALIGAVALLGAVGIALAPRAVVLAASAAAIAAAVAGAVAWPQGDDRPPGGAIADAFDSGPYALTFVGDTPYRVVGDGVYAVPAPDREYFAAAVWDGFEWTPEDPAFDTFSADGVAYSGGTLYVALGGVDRLVSLTPGGEPRMLVARPPERERNDPPLPDGVRPQLVDAFVGGPLAPAPGGVYVLYGNEIGRWRDGRLERIAGRRSAGLDGDGGPARDARFDSPQSIAAGPGGALYVADTGNGRVRRIDADGTIETVIGTEAAHGCVRRGLDEALALDALGCTGVQAVAVGPDGTLYLALRGVAMIAGMTPEGELGVVAGTGPKGWSDGDGRAVRARLGEVDALTVGPDGDLYVTEAGPVRRVRRIADPAVDLDGAREEPARDAPACREIAALMASTVDLEDPEALERSLNALADAAPPEVADDVDELARGIAGGEDAITLIGFAMAPDEEDVSLGDYAEEECGLIGGFDVPLAEARTFCVAYQRYRDRGELAAAGEEPPAALPAVVDAAPPFLVPAGRDALRRLESAAGRAVPQAEVETVAAGVEALDTVASSMCALS